MSARPGSERCVSDGFTGVDVVIALALATSLSALAWPLAASVLDTAEARHATVSLGAAIRRVRSLATSTRHTTGLIFERIGAVRVGATDLISCSASRGCTSGTIFVRSRGGVKFAARLAGATGRVRVLRYEPGSRRWREE